MARRKVVNRGTTLPDINVDEVPQTPPGEIVVPEDIAPPSEEEAGPLAPAIPDDDEVVILRAGKTKGEFGPVAELLLQSYPPGYKLEITKAKAKYFIQLMAGRLKGHQLSMLLRCAGERCIFAGHCTLIEADMPLPIGHQCPLELMLFRERVSLLCNELGVRPDDKDQYVDYNLIRDLAAVELVMERISYEISDEATQVRYEMAGVTQDGDPIEKEEVNKRYQRWERLQTMKMKILTELSATRRERIKAGVLTQEDASTYLLNLVAAGKKKKREIAIDQGVDPDLQIATLSESVESNEDEMVTIDDIDAEPSERHTEEVRGE